MRAREALTVSILAVIALTVGCGGGSPSDVATVVPHHVSAVKGCKVVTAPTTKPVQVPLPSQPVQRGEKLTATVNTSCGSFTIALDTTDSPKTSAEFADLARRGVFDGTDFHRVVEDFVIQGGNEQLTGPNGRSFTTVEPPPQNISYRRGDVAMAKGDTDPIGAGSGDFFVVTAPSDASLHPDYALIGKVASGMSTVERIASLADPALAATGGGQPLQPVVIDSVTVH
jgi:peptidyl-prolyl cis-trans isomerase B (cyclophilin B)